jgi:hypothetical protein
LQDASEQVTAIALETAVQLALVEEALKGGPPVPPLRADIARDQFMALARIGATSKVMSAAALKLGKAVGNAVNPATMTPTNIPMARTELSAAIEEYQATAQKHLYGSWWDRFTQ